MRSALIVVLASSAAYADAVQPPPLTIDTVFDGQRGPSGTLQTAPDVGGAAGPEQVVDVVSGFVTVRDSVGHVLTSSTAEAFWTAAGVTGTPAAFSQHAAFNPLNQRWYVTAEEATNGTPNRIYLAVSASGDARGPWKAIALPLQAQAIANTQLAVDACGAYITGDTAGNGIVMALPYSDLQWTGAGAPSAAHVNVLTAHAGIVPAIDPTNQIGSDARMFLARNGTTKVDLYRLSWQSPLCTSTLSATLAEPISVDLGGSYALPSRAAVQPAPAPGLAAGTGAIASAASSNGEIVGIATTQVSGQLAAFWFQLYADPSTVGPATLEYFELIADPSADLIAPAIALAPYSGVGVVLVRTSATEMPSMYVTAHSYADYEMRPLVLARAGTAAYSCAPVAGVSAFGRYSSIASTATGFWAVAQYGASANACEFGTAWVNFDEQYYGGHDDVIFGDDAGVGHGPDKPPFHFFGCAGCASSGGSAPALAVIVVLALRRRRR
jgi:hypothetical protein